MAAHEAGAETGRLPVGTRMLDFCLWMFAILPFASVASYAFISWMKTM